MKRTRINLSNTHLTTCEMGNLIPFEWYDCLPNDIAKISCNITMKAQPMIAPLMHRINMLTQYYFVPYRILWDDWAEFITGGEDGTASPAYPIMKTSATSTINTLEDYIGIPNKTGIEYSALPIRAYNKIWNDHYKIDDIQNEQILNTTSGLDTQTNKNILNCNWARDRFTRAKTFTQRGQQINVPIYPRIVETSTIQNNNQYALYKPRITVTRITGDIAEITGKKFLGNAYYNLGQQTYNNNNYNPVYTIPINTKNFMKSFNSSTANITPNDTTGYFALYRNNGEDPYRGGASNTCSVGTNFYKVLYCLINITWGNPISYENAPFNDIKITVSTPQIAECQSTYKDPYGGTDPDPNNPITVVNKYQSLAPGTTKLTVTLTRGIAVKQVETQNLGELNIRDLRVASALQRYQEKSLKYGAEYEDYCKMEFNCRPRDSRLQKSEYLGGSQGILQISEVLQTSDEENSPLGNQAGYAIGKVQQKRIRYRCPEHGIIIGLLSIRPETIYTQGIDRALLKRERFDYWTRELVGIGAQEILQQEIYADESNKGKMFGYDLNGNYREYYSKRSRVSGNFKTNLNFWHLGRFFEHPPILNNSFLEMIPDKRPFAIQDKNLPAFLCYIQNSAIFYRPIPRKVKNILR